MFNLWSLEVLSQLLQLDHLSAFQAVHGRVQPWHTNLPCETGPGGSGLSFVLDQEFLQLKARSQSQHDFNWVQNVATQHFSQVTNLNVLLPEAFTPRVRMIIFQKALMWHICRGWISNSTATEPKEPTEPMEPMEPMELTEPMEQCEKMLPSNMTCKTCYKCNQDLKVYKQTFRWFVNSSKPPY